MRGALLRRRDAINYAGGRLTRSRRSRRLPQYAATGCLNSTYYASAEDQLQKVLALVIVISTSKVAKGYQRRP